MSSRSLGTSKPSAMNQPESNDVEFDPAAAMEKLTLIDPTSAKCPPLPGAGALRFVNPTNSSPVLMFPTDTFHRQASSGRSLPTDSLAFRQWRPPHRTVPSALHPSVISQNRPSMTPHRILHSCPKLPLTTGGLGGGFNLTLAKVSSSMHDGDSQSQSISIIGEQEENLSNLPAEDTCVYPKEKRVVDGQILKMGLEDRDGRPKKADFKNKDKEPVARAEGTNRVIEQLFDPRAEEEEAPPQDPRESRRAPG